MKTFNKVLVIGMVTVGFACAFNGMWMATTVLNNLAFTYWMVTSKE